MTNTYWRARFEPLRLREARELRGWSQGELNRRIGKYPGTIHKYEKGSHTPGFETLCLLTEVLEIDVLKLLRRGTEVDLPILRVRVRMNQEAVAAAIGLSRPMYQKIEAKQRSITRHKLTLLARVLDTDEASIAPHVKVADS